MEFRIGSMARQFQCRRPEDRHERSVAGSARPSGGSRTIGGQAQAVARDFALTQYYRHSDGQHDLVACNGRSEPGGIEVLPFDGLGPFIVIADVAHELALQVGKRSEHAARKDIPLDLREPLFNLIEPR